MAEIVSLWPDDIFNTPDIRLPVDILKQQATFIGEKTGQAIIGEIVTATESNQDIRHRFYIVAPALANYKYLLFMVDHGIALYPLRVYWQNDWFSAKNEMEFDSKIREIFAADSTRKVIVSLLAQSRNQ